MYEAQEDVLVVMVVEGTSIAVGQAETLVGGGGFAGERCRPCLRWGPQDSHAPPAYAHFHYRSAETLTARSYATALRPFFATSVNNFSEAPRGRFSPRSHWLTSPVVTLR